MIEARALFHRCSLPSHSDHSSSNTSTFIPSVPRTFHVMVLRVAALYYIEWRNVHCVPRIKCERESHVVSSSSSSLPSQSLPLFVGRRTHPLLCECAVRCLLSTYKLFSKEKKKVSEEKYCVCKVVNMHVMHTHTQTNKQCVYFGCSIVSRARGHRQPVSKHF